MDGLIRMEPVMTGRRSYGPSSLVLEPWLALPPHVSERVRWVRSVFVAPSRRGQGLATELMRHVCAEADACGVVLALEALAFGSGARMPSPALVHWYGTLGFVPMPPAQRAGEAGVRMWRAPRQRSAVLAMNGVAEMLPIAAAIDEVVH